MGPGNFHFHMFPGKDSAAIWGTIIQYWVKEMLESEVPKPDYPFDRVGFLQNFFPYSSEL